MKVIISSFLTIATAAISQAATTIYHEGDGAWSYVGDPYHGAQLISSNYWAASNFVSPGSVNGDYSMTVALNFDASGGTTNGFQVALYSNTGTYMPSATIGTFTGTGDPDGSATYTYTLDSVSLTPNTAYWIVVSSSSSTGEYRPLFTDGGAFPAIGARVSGMLFSTDAGANWGTYGASWRHSDLDMLVSVSSPIPEPACTGFAGVASVLFLRRRKRRHS